MYTNSESLCYTPETDKILYGNYVSINKRELSNMYMVKKKKVDYEKAVKLEVQGSLLSSFSLWAEYISMSIGLWS